MIFNYLNWNPSQSYLSGDMKLKEPTERPENGGCVDVNECMDNPCMKNALCLNTLGSFQCQCKGKW